MKDMLELKANIRRVAASMEDFYNVEMLKDDFFNKYLQQEEAELFIYDLEDNVELIPVSIHDVFIKKCSYALWYEEGYSYTAVGVIVGSYNEDLELSMKCEINLIYNHEMKLADADYYEISGK